MSERENGPDTGTDSGADDALTVLRGIWSATGQTSAELEERFGRHPGKVCKNMKNIGFGGMPGDPVDRARVRLADGVEPATFFVRLTQALVKMLQERTADGYVFRTDLRLRPDPARAHLFDAASGVRLAA